MTETNQTLAMVFAMGAVIVFCRAFPFLFSGSKSAVNKAAGLSRAKLLTFIEKIVPPAAMTVLTFNILGGAFRENLSGGTLTLISSAFTAALHLWKRSTLLSIIGGTALYMILTRAPLF